MTRPIRIPVGAAIAMLALGCGHDECPQGDLHCYLEHIMLFELEHGGEQLPSERVEAKSIPVASEPPAVWISNVPPGAEYTTPRTLMPLELTWVSDACKQVPGFCFQLCIHDQPLGRCTRKAECTSSLPGTSPAGAFRVAMGYLAEPEELRERFFAVVTPVCVPNGGDVAAALARGGAGVAAGPPLIVEQIVVADEDPTGGALLPNGAASSASGSGGAGGGAGGSGGAGGG